ncbi:MAG TPA: NAD-dependent epimerase/dehydratase family protein [Herpetosiphonaceae bacterium]|nr:NAD-dependent epimerase/dehydratase family protein [Herpetosiphonaceae bacterium]
MSAFTASERPALITGGAGFVGTNVAWRLLEMGRPVLLFDNLSRPGVERNLAALRRRFGDQARLITGDVRDGAALAAAVAQAGQVYHFAAQVAVTTSLADPLGDFEINARGTVNLLEAMRRLDNPPSLLFTSTNKVYGSLPDVGLRLEGERYQPTDPATRAHGIGEGRPLDFHSPYGCSKGAADQYVIDYARTFDLPAVVFRMSCIYGPHQQGNEDQGWVAHFLIRALEGRPLTIYGDGKQVRDVLYVDDLVNAMLLAQHNIGRLSGQAFNIGGGAANTLSLLELLDQIGELHGERPLAGFAATRPGDQRFYVSDIRAFQAATGWTPTVGVREGIERLAAWVLESKGGALARAAGELAR